MLRKLLLKLLNLTEDDVHCPDCTYECYPIAKCRACERRDELEYERYRALAPEREKQEAKERDRSAKAARKKALKQARAYLKQNPRLSEDEKERRKKEIDDKLKHL